ncbi:MAG: hypothetical protein BBJ57_07365 [Desulfobacterales bacterium PC51MH44]|nr:MAG: hypothetical protein BBJ57_07365 [Desulfobacterales bacterium PC51MH44]
MKKKKEKILSKAFWDKWTKHKLPFKVMAYRCGCSYIYITDKNKQILKNHSSCPVHKVSKTHILLWCEVCGLRIEAPPRAGYRQIRCHGCGKAFLLEYNRLNYKTKYGGRYKTGPKKQKTELQEINEEDENAANVPRLAVARFIKSMKQDLPKVETPILDKYLGRNLK